MTNVESSPEINGLGDYMQKVFIWNVNMQLTGRGMNQQALCAPLGLKKGAVSAKMTGKTTWTIQDIAAVAEFLNVSPLYLLDATMYEQMMRGMSGDGGASLVAVATAGFPVRPSEGQADGLKPLETKGSGPRYLVETGARWVPPERVELSLSDESLCLTVRRWGRTTRITLREVVRLCKSTAFRRVAISSG